MRISIHIIPAVLLLAGCAGARKSTAPEPMMVDHPMHTPILVSTMMMEREANALQDSAIMRVVRAHVDEWNRGNLEGFLTLYDEGAEYVQGDGYSNARQAVRRMHTERWFKEGGSPSVQLSARLVQTRSVGDARRRGIVVWSATDAASGREETWRSELTFQRFPSSDWRVVREAPPPPEG